MKYYMMEIKSSMEHEWKTSKKNESTGLGRYIKFGNPAVRIKEINKEYL